MMKTLTMLDYIHEEQHVCQTILANYPENVKPAVQALKGAKNHWLFVATGSSNNAVECARYFIQQVTQTLVDVIEPAYLNYYATLPADVDLLLFVSQSGHSASTLQAAEKVAHLPPKKIAITAQIDSHLTELTDSYLNIGCGEEKVGFVTKGFSSTVLSLMLLGLYYAYHYQKITFSQHCAYLSQITLAIKQINHSITLTENFYQQHANHLLHKQKYAFIGYGPLYGIAKECETKFTETVRLPSQGYELEAFMHGPYLEVSQHHCLFYLDSQAHLSSRALALYDYFSETAPSSYLLSTAKQGVREGIGLNVEIDELLSPLVMAAPIQLLSYCIAINEGIDLSVRIFDDFDRILKSKI